MLYPARADLAPGLRMAVHGRYLVLYRDLPGENTVRVERVLHSARNLRWLL
jgi:toxin ParE1/3/4